MNSMGWQTHVAGLTLRRFYRMKEVMVAKVISVIDSGILNHRKIQIDSVQCVLAILHPSVCV